MILFFCKICFRNDADASMVCYLVNLSNRQHEQDQHNKEISDLVHGIAAGSLWKRRNGQMNDLDLFDEEDMDGRFRRKKKLKVSEKFEKLGKSSFFV